MHQLTALTPPLESTMARKLSVDDDAAPVVVLLHTCMSRQFPAGAAVDLPWHYAFYADIWGATSFFPPRI